LISKKFFEPTAVGSKIEFLFSRRNLVFSKKNQKKMPGEVWPMIDAFLGTLEIDDPSSDSEASDASNAAHESCDEPNLNDFEDVEIESLENIDSNAQPIPGIDDVDLDAMGNENSDADSQPEVDQRLAWCANASDSESPLPKRRIVYVGSGSDSESPVPKARVLANTNSNATPAVANTPTLIYK